MDVSAVDKTDQTVYFSHCQGKIAPPCSCEVHHQSYLLTCYCTLISLRRGGQGQACTWRVPTLGILKACVYFLVQKPLNVDHNDTETPEI